MWIIWRNNQNWKIVRKYASMPSHWIWDQSPSKRQFGGLRGWSFFCAHKPSPWLIGIKWENTKICQLDGKMNIFQKDGKGENIPKNKKTQLRTIKTRGGSIGFRGETIKNMDKDLTFIHISHHLPSRSIGSKWETARLWTKISTVRAADPSFRTPTNHISLLRSSNSCHLLTVHFWL